MQDQHIPVTCEYPINKARLHYTTIFWCFISHKAENYDNTATPNQILFTELVCSSIVNTTHTSSSILVQTGSTIMQAGNFPCLWENENPLPHNTNVGTLLRLSHPFAYLWHTKPLLLTIQPVTVTVIPVYRTESTQPTLSNLNGKCTDTSKHAVTTISIDLFYLHTFIHIAALNQYIWTEV